MTGQSRFSANSMFRTEEEARKGHRRIEARPLPERALPCSGISRRYCIRHSKANVLTACAGSGAWAASTSGTIGTNGSGCVASVRTNATAYPGADPILLRHSTIAICFTGVLNAPRAPIASRTGRLTRHERITNSGRTYAKTRGGPKRYSRRTAASDYVGRAGKFRLATWERLSALPIGCRDSHRTQLRGLTSAGVAALS
jgi:hypothetical protein